MAAAAAASAGGTAFADQLRRTALAAQFPNLVTPVNLPNLTNGYQRKSQAIMYGTNGIGVAPPATHRRPR